MAVELATAYVSLVASAKGIGKSIADELTGPLGAAADKGGQDAGDRLSKGLLSGTAGTGQKLVAALGLAALGAAAFKSAVDVEDANNIIVRTTGASGKALEGLEESFRNVASGSGASFETIATGLSQVYQRTGLTGGALEGLTSQVVSFNRMMKDTPITVDALTTAMAGFNVPAKDMGKELDRLFVISQKTGVPLQEILDTVTAAGPIARQFGFSLDFTAGFLAQLNKAGLETNQILPGLKKVFKDAAEAGKEPAEALRDFVGQLQALIAKGDILGARQLAVAVFGPKGAGLVDAAIAGKLSLESLTTTFDATGAGILETAGKTGTLSGALGILKNNAKLALASFATPALEAANSALRSILPAIKSIGDEFAKLPQFVQVGVVGLVGAGLALGKIAVFASQAGPALAGVGNALKSGFGAASSAIAGATSMLQGFTAAEIASTAVAAAPFVAILAGALAVGFALHTLIGGGFEDFFSKLKQGQVEGEKFGKTLIASANATAVPIDSLKSKLADLNAQLANFHSTHAGGDFESNIKGYQRLKGAIASVKDEIAAQKQAHAEEAAALQAANTALGSYNTAVSAGGDATRLFADLSDEAKQAVEDLQGALLAAAGGQIGYQQAVINVAKAQEANKTAVFGVFVAQQGLNDATAQYGPNSDQARTAQEALTTAQGVAKGTNLDLQSAQLAAAQATLTLDANERKLLDSVGGTTAGIDTEIGRLKEAQRQHPETADSINPLIYQLLVLKSKVEGVPPERQIDIRLNAGNTLDVLGDIASRINNIPNQKNIFFNGVKSGDWDLKGFAGGGRPNVGEVVRVGELGPELFVPDRPGTIIPTSDIARHAVASTASMPASDVRNGPSMLHADIYLGSEKIDEKVVRLTDARAKATVRYAGARGGGR